jgi:arsenate reductase
MIKITHNNKCSKSRSSLEILKNSGVDFEVVNYLDGVLNEKELKNILGKLNFSAEKIVRKGENIFKENFKEKSKTFSEKD